MCQSRYRADNFVGHTPTVSAVRLCYITTLLMAHHESSSL